MIEESRANTNLSLLERLGDSRLRDTAWKEFIGHYSRLFFVWFNEWHVDPFEMEDVLQETLVRVLGSLKSFERQRQGSFRSWLRTIAHHSWRTLSQDSLRHMAQRETNPDRLQNWAGLCSQNAENSLIQLFDSWATEELLSLAQNRVRHRVDEETWATYQKIVLEDVPAKQLIATQNLRANVIYSRVFRVKRMLKAELIALESEDFQEHTP